MKCLADTNKLIALSQKRMQQIIPQISKFTTALTVFILFDSFKWKEERVRDFLNRYDTYSNMIVQTKYNTLPYEDRPKEGWTFEEFAQMNNDVFAEEGAQRYKLKNSRVKSKNIVIKRTEELQDYCLAWILDVILMTLIDKFGWHSTMCNKFARLYDSNIPLLDNCEDVTNGLLMDLKNRYGFELEIH